MNEIDNLQIPPQQQQKQQQQREEEEKSSNKNHNKTTTVGRISRLFQKKSKKKPSNEISSSLSHMSISDPSLLKQTTFASSSSIAGSDLSIPNNNTEEQPKRSSSVESRFIPSVLVHNNNSSNTNVETASQLSRSMSISSNLSTMNIQQLIAQQRHFLADLDNMKQMYQNDNAKLQDQLVKTQEKVQQRTMDMETLKNNYQLHLKSARSSDDDPKSIAIKLSQLRTNIAILAKELLPFAEPILTTEKLSTLWTNLGESINQLGKPLPPERIQMLTEKFMMDVLVQNLNINIFPGLTCNSEFMELSSWFDQNDSSFFSTRLRQELSLVVAKRNKEESGGDIEQIWKKCVDRNWHHLYRGLQKAYPSFLISTSKGSANTSDYSQETITRATEYSKKLRNLVEETIQLGSAIKGQEVCITAVDIREGVQPFDGHLMQDEDDQTTGTIAFCISPPFVVKISNRYEPLLKGRVLCFPSPPNSEQQPSISTSSNIITTSTSTTQK